eukprot:110525-Prorocentrum_minimum.AAC.1
MGGNETAAPARGLLELPPNAIQLMLKVPQTLMAHNSNKRGSDSHVAQLPEQDISYLFSGNA